jgi:hypothetical protein
LEADQQLAGLGVGFGLGEGGEPFEVDEGDGQLDRGIARLAGRRRP